MHNATRMAELTCLETFWEVESSQRTFYNNNIIIITIIIIPYNILLFIQLFKKSLLTH